MNMVINDLSEVAKTLLTMYGILLTSLILGAVLCLFMSIPYFNPSMTRDVIMSRFKSIMWNSTATIFVVAPVFAWTGGYDILINAAADYRVSMHRIIMYILIVECLFYVYHRMLHMQPFYKMFHARHHENINVYPFDTFHLDWIDTMGTALSILLPVYLIRVTYWEYVFVNMLYVTGALIVHSDVIFSVHAIHHRRFVCNYCFLFPVVDFTMGTLRWNGDCE
jgi:sterol desaturase/sphingolipid hydroxylase (fatty acid hydroxylase superfamily)